MEHYIIRRSINSGLDLIKYAAILAAIVLFVAGCGDKDDGSDTQQLKITNEQITITMPSVPNVTGGTLNKRAGNNTVVTVKNVKDFFTEIKNNKFGWINTAPRAVNENKSTWEFLEHGRKSGYVIQKGDYTGQENYLQMYYFSAKIEEIYYDYSNNGVLYFGGGYGIAAFGNSSSNVYSVTGEVILNGKVGFNGKFQGELVFDNFKYKYEYDNDTSEYARISGSVKIGSLDVSEMFLEYYLGPLD